MNDLSLSHLTADATILIVDDNGQYAMILSKLLQSVYNFRNVEIINNPEAAYEAIIAAPQRFRVLFIDYRFPSGQTGGDLLARLAKEKLLQGKAAFLITSEPTVENLREAMTAGALGVIAKPFDREELRKSLEKADRVLRAENTESF